MNSSADPASLPEIRVLIADDHAMVRSGLQRIIDSEPGLCVSGQAVDGASTLVQLQDERCDVLLLDMTMPAPSGPNLIGQIRVQWPKLPILVVSMHHEAAIVRAALQAGANGYITKDSEPQALLQALRRVAGNGRYVEPRLLDAMVFAPPVPARQALSPRECQVLQRLAAGQSNSVIARALFLSEKTISSHKTNLMVKLGVENMADLVRYADQQLPVNGEIGETPA
jgi:DNA-binding NarL/FixJ family response regulator